MEAESCHWRASVPTVVPNLAEPGRSTATHGDFDHWFPFDLKRDRSGWVLVVWLGD
jgi:hypothetical protein